MRFGLVADARLLIVENRYLRGWDRLWPNLTHDYFWSSSGASIPYWRPLTKASWLIEQQLGGGAPWLFHLVQLAWLVAAMVVVQALVKRFGGRDLSAAVASLLFALHPSVAEPVALVMARSDLVAAVGAGLAVIGFLDWRQQRRGGLALHVVGLLLALGSKESGVLVLPMIALLWLIVERPLNRATLFQLVPSVVLTVGYLVVRGTILAGAEGAGVIFDPVRIAIAGGSYLRHLHPFLLVSKIRNVPFGEAQSTPALLAALATWVGFFIAASTLLRAVRRGGDLRAPWLVVAALLPLVPVLIVKKVYVPSVEGKLALADRWLLTSLLFAAVGWGWLLDVVATRWPQLIKALAILVVVLVGGHVAWTPVLLAPYQSELTLLDKEDDSYQRTPEAFRTDEDHCRAGDRAMMRAAAAEDLDRAQRAYGALPAVCQRRIDAAFNLLSLLVRHEQYATARPLVDALLLRTSELDERNQGPFAYLAGAVLANTGDPARAQSYLEEAIRRGVLTCSVLEALARAFDKQGKIDDAARATAKAAACRGQKR